MKKMIKNMLFLSILALLASVASIWAIVEFILYLVKDDPFNWWSVISVAVLYVLIIVLQMMNVKEIMKEPF